MASNLCTPLFDPADNITVQADSAVTGKRFVALVAGPDDGPGLNTGTGGGAAHVAHASAGGTALGVAEYDAAEDALVGCLREGCLPVTADGSISAGGLVKVGAAGKAKAATAGSHVVGQALNTCTDGQDCYVFVENIGGGGGGTDIVAQTHITDPTVTGTASTTAITAASGEATAAALADTQALAAALQSDIADLYTSIASTNTKLAATLDALEANGILAP